MSPMETIALVIALGVFGLLVWAMIRPEQF